MTSLATLHWWISSFSFFFVKQNVFSGHKICMSKGWDIGSTPLGKVLECLAFEGYLYLICDRRHQIPARGKWWSPESHQYLIHPPLSLHYIFLFHRHKCAIFAGMTRGLYCSHYIKHFQSDCPAIPKGYRGSRKLMSPVLLSVPNNFSLRKIIIIIVLVVTKHCRWWYFYSQLYTTRLKFIWKRHWTLHSSVTINIFSDVYFSLYFLESFLFYIHILI